MTLPADQQNEYLTLADNEGLSVSELKKKISEAHPSKPRGEKPVVKVKIDITDAAAVLDAMKIVVNWIAKNQFTELDGDAWEPLMQAVSTEYLRRYATLAEEEIK